MKIPFFFLTKNRFIFFEVFKHKPKNYFLFSKIVKHVFFFFLDNIKLFLKRVIKIRSKKLIIFKKGRLH